MNHRDHPADHSGADPARVAAKLRGVQWATAFATLSHRVISIPEAAMSIVHPVPPAFAKSARLHRDEYEKR
ncbi:MAG: hypothetical protein ACREP1_03075, partial [Rhodanobacteraceae bacterium]